MKKDNIPLINGSCYYLKILTVADITKTYVEWLNDDEIMRFTEQNNSNHTFETVERFVDDCYKSNNTYLFGMFTFEDAHFGNIKLGPINLQENEADISYVIGNKEMWGKGLATEIISQIVDFAFNSINLRRIYAGTYTRNIGSLKALKNNDFLELEFLRNNSDSDKKIDTIRLFRVNPKG